MAPRDLLHPKFTTLSLKAKHHYSIPWAYIAVGSSFEADSTESYRGGLAAHYPKKNDTIAHSLNENPFLLAIPKSHLTYPSHLRRICTSRFSQFATESRTQWNPTARNRSFTTHSLTPTTTAAFCRAILGDRGERRPLPTPPTPPTPTTPTITTYNCPTHMIKPNYHAKPRAQKLLK